MNFPPAPPRPVGSGSGPDSPALIYMQRIWDIHWDPKTSIFIDTPQIKFSKTPKGYLPILRIPKSTSKGGSKSDYAGIYVKGQQYDALEWVVVQNGNASGAFISTADKNTNDPITGINWVQFSALPQWF